MTQQIQGHKEAQLDDLPERPHKMTTSWVSYANDLARAAWSLNIQQTRLVYMAMAKLKPEIDVKEGQPPITPIRIHASDWKAIFPDETNPYQRLRDAANGMMKESWRVDHEDGTYTRYAWMARIKYAKGEGYVELLFNHDTALRLHGIFAGDFNSHLYLETARLTSTYHVALYRFLSSWRDTGWAYIELSQLRALLDAEDVRPRFADFNRRILQPALKAINSNTALRVTKVEFVRRGRKIHALKFKIGANKQLGMKV